MRSPESFGSLELEPNAELAARMENRARGEVALQADNIEADHRLSGVAEKAKANSAFKAFISGIAVLSAAASIFSVTMATKQASENARLKAQIEAQEQRTKDVESSLQRIKILQQISEDVYSDNGGRIQANEQAQAEADKREIPIDKAPTGGQEFEDALADLGISSATTPSPDPVPAPTPVPYPEPAQVTEPRPQPTPPSELERIKREYSEMLDERMLDPRPKPTPELPQDFPQEPPSKR